MKPLDAFMCLVVLAAGGAAFMLAIQSYVNRERSVLQAALGAHVVAGFAYQSVVYYVFGYGDAMHYHFVARQITAELRNNLTGMLPEIIKVAFQRPNEFPAIFHGKESTETMSALTGLMSLVLLDSRWAIHLGFAMISLLGKLGIYKLVRDSFTPRERPLVAAAVMLSPSFVYWTSGIIKESVTVSGMGFAAWGFVAVRRGQIFGLIPLIFGIWFAALIKPHIMIAGALGAGAYLYWVRSVRRGVVEIRPFSLLMGVALAFGGMLIVGQVFPRFALNAVLDEAATLQESGNRGGSGFSLGAEGAGPAAQAAIAPLALLTAWYRPVLFEARNPLMLVSALENALWLYLTFRAVNRLRYSGLFRRLVQHPILAFALVFALVLGTGVGLGSANLGTLSRYRAPMMPFFVLVLVALNLPERKTAPAAAKPPPRPRRQRPPPFRARTPAPAARPAPSPAPYGSRTPRATP